MDERDTVSMSASQHARREARLMPYRSPLAYRKPAIPAGHERYEALTLRMFDFSSHVGSDRPGWMSVRMHRALLRLRMAAFIARCIWRDEWGAKEVAQ